MAIQKIPFVYVGETVAGGKTVHVGNLTEYDLAAMLEACRTSRLFRESDKRKFFY